MQESGYLSLVSCPRQVFRVADDYIMALMMGESAQLSVSSRQGHDVSLDEARCNRANIMQR